MSGPSDKAMKAAQKFGRRHELQGRGGPTAVDFDLGILLDSYADEKLEEAAKSFEQMRWLCLDHGGEESEKIVERIRSFIKGTR